MKVDGYAIEHTEDGWQISLTAYTRNDRDIVELTMSLSRFVELVGEVHDTVGHYAWRTTVHDINYPPGG